MSNLTLNNGWISVNESLPDSCREMTYRDQGTSSSKNQIDSLSNLIK